MIFLLRAKAKAGNHRDHPLLAFRSGREAEKRKWPAEMITESFLLELATRFRKALDDADKSKWGIQFKHFPRGSCGDVPEMFGKYLLHTYGIDSFYVCGWSTDHTSHAWLECGRLVIDITGDQFNDEDQFRDHPLRSVYISPDRRWHARWFPKQEKSPLGKMLRNNAAQCNWAWGAAYRDLAAALGRTPAATRDGHDC